MKVQNILLSLNICLLMGLSVSDYDLLVEIESGVIIQGSIMTTMMNRKILAFRGIPYAEPPIGELRFKPPVVKKWSEKTFDATQKGPECLQTKLISILPDISVSKRQEDCLVLNVYTKEISKTKLKQVMIFIHGGGFLTDSSIKYGPRKLLDRDIVLVTLNYRLGPFGFLSTLDEASPGNYGLLDQIEAMKWVQRNIAAFGGDPNEVTVFGESAGSVCVFDHMLSPLSKGLFHRAIAQSGNPFSFWGEQPDPMHWTKLLTEKVNCLQSNTKELIQCLRKLSADTLQEASNALFEKYKRIQYAPTADGYFFSNLSSTLLASAKIANRVPVMIGMMGDEGLLISSAALFISNMASKAPLDDTIKQLLGITLNLPPSSVTSETVRLMREQYFGFNESLPQRLLEDKMSDAVTDRMFAVHIKAIKNLLKAGLDVYVYSFDYITNYRLTALFSKKIGASHADDLFFLFDDPVTFPFVYWKKNDRTENKFLDIWTNFAKTGIPTESSGIKWLPAQAKFINIHHLNKKITIDYYNQEKDWKLDFWTQKIPNAQHNTIVSIYD